MTRKYSSPRYSNLDGPPRPAQLITWTPHDIIRMYRNSSNIVSEVLAQRSSCSRKNESPNLSYTLYDDVKSAWLNGVRGIFRGFIFMRTSERQLLRELSLYKEKRGRERLFG